MIKEEVDLVFPLFDGAAETGKITRKAFTEWVVSLLKHHSMLFILTVVVIWTSEEFQDYWFSCLWLRIRVCVS